MITGTYNLIANPSWALTQLQEVRLECDTTLGPVTINLPAISTLAISTNLKLIIVDVTANASVNNITINAGTTGLPPVSDTFDDSTTNQIVLDTNGSSIIFQNVAATQWIATESISGGISAPIDVAYSGLYSKVVNNELVPGQWYRLTDYKSANFLNGYSCAFLNSNLNGNPSSSSDFNPREVYIGDNEVLLLQAISSGELSPIGYSETFEGDIVQYEPLTNKIGVLFNITNGGSLPNGGIISGFDLQWDSLNNEAYFNMPTGYPLLYGQVMSLFAQFDNGSGIKYKQNGFFFTTQNVTAPEISYTSDNVNLNEEKQTSRIFIKNNGTRVVLLDLNQADVNIYVTGSLVVDTTFEISDCYGWITKRTNPTTNVTTPFDFRGRKFRRFEVDLTAVNSDLGTGFCGIGDDFGGFGTTGTFSDFNVFQNATNLIWTGLGFGFDSIGDNDNNVFLGYVADVTIKNGFANNTLGVNSMSTSPVFENSIIDNYFRLNVVGDKFANNSIGTGFGQNVIANNFENNIIPRNFIENFGILNGFKRNTFNVDTQVTNYSGASYVYGDYTCTINRRQDGTSTISYVDNTDLYLTTSPANA